MSKILAGDWYPRTKQGGAATEQCSSSNEQKHLCLTETEMETKMGDSCQTRIVIRLILNSKQQTAKAHNNDDINGDSKRIELLCMSSEHFDTERLVRDHLL